MKQRRNIRGRRDSRIIIPRESGAARFTSQKRFGENFPSLDASQKEMLLKDASTNPTEKDASEKNAGDKQVALHDHFENLKGWVSGAYYSSEAGMRQLGWTGEYVFESFPGCEHAEGHH